MAKRHSISGLNSNSELSTVVYDEAMLLIGFGKVHWYILINCGLLLMFVTCETMGVAILDDASHCDLKNGGNYQILLKCIVFLGIVTASLFWGYLCDIYGRRKILLYTTTWSASMSLISMFMSTKELFILFRYLTGIGLGGPSFVSLTYLGEFCSNKYRAIIITYMSMFNGIAMLYCPVLGHLLIHHEWNYDLTESLAYVPWRLFGNLMTLPGLIGLFMLTWLPESPQYQLAMGNESKCYEILNRLSIKNNGRDLKSFGVLRVVKAGPITAVPQRDSSAFLTFRQRVRKDINPLCSKKFIYLCIKSCCTMFCLLYVANGVAIWFTDLRNINDMMTTFTHKLTFCELVEQASVNFIEVEEFVCNDKFLSFMDSMFLGITFFIIYNILALLLRCVRRKVIFEVSMVLSSISALVLVWVKHWIIIKMVFILFLAFPTVITNLLSGAIVEFVPTKIRGKVMCLVMTVGRCGSILGTWLVGSFIVPHCIIIINIIGVVLLGLKWNCIFSSSITLVETFFKLY